MKQVKLYGIPNCDTTKKAISLLRENSVTVNFHDYKQEGINEARLNAWCNKAGWEAIFNKRSTTWKELSAAGQEKVVDQASAIRIMLQHNSIIKRPVIETGTNLIVGFNKTEITKHLNLKT